MSTIPAMHLVQLKIAEHGVRANVKVAQTAVAGRYRASTCLPSRGRRS